MTEIHVQGSISLVNVLFFKKRNLKNGLLYNIDIGLILKTVHCAIMSLNFIGLEKEILNEIVQLPKLIFFRLFIFFLFLRLQENA